MALLAKMLKLITPVLMDDEPVMVRFVNDAGYLGERVMDAIPREGESVTLDGDTHLIVWNVAWQLCEGSAQVAWVALKTRQERDRAIRAMAR
jgi:hypothetical protein